MLNESRLKSATRVVSLVVALLIAASTSADVRLPRIYGSNMVLQRDMPVRIRGWAEAGEEVTVSIGEASAKATADAKGRWSTELPAMKAGGPHVMTVQGTNRITLKDVLVGEVWVCSGQSNMQWSVAGVPDAAKEMAAATFPNIRLFTAPRVTSGEPEDDVQGSWSVCSPSTVRGFTAVGYFFGRRLHKELSVPVGLINSSWGGTRIEPWTPREAFGKVPELAAIAKQVEGKCAAYAGNRAKMVGEVEAWLPKAKAALASGDRFPPFPVIRHPLDNRAQPTGLYNAMISGLLPFAIRGAIWYQGEANHREGMAYLHKMKALVGGWRSVWKQGDFPFYYVQLAPYGGYTKGCLPVFWEAQTAAMAIPNTGMAVINDVGNPKNIHPRNKQVVGARLALWALAKTYGKDIVYTGPLYKSMTVEGKGIRIAFDHATGLKSRDGKPLTFFEIAGKDGKYAPADAIVDGETVVVSSPTVPEPTAARFAWDNIASPELVNGAGIPANSFRTNRPTK